MAIRRKSKPALPAKPLPRRFARFDGREMWARLTAEQQRKIGALALELVACDIGDDEVLPDSIRRALTEAYHVIVMDLGVTVLGAVPERAWSCPETGDPLVPSRLGLVCRSCGCSQTDGCAEGCGWS